MVLHRRNFSGGVSPGLIWLQYFSLWGTLVVGENVGKHTLRCAGRPVLSVRPRSCSPAAGAARSGGCSPLLSGLPSCTAPTARWPNRPGPSVVLSCSAAGVAVPTVVARLLTLVVGECAEVCIALEGSSSGCLRFPTGLWAPQCTRRWLRAPPLHPPHTCPQCKSWWGTFGGRPWSNWAFQRRQHGTQSRRGARCKRRRWERGPPDRACCLACA